MSADQVRGHVHSRVWERLLERRILGDIDLARAVAAGLLGEGFDARARDQRRDLATELDGLAENAEGVLLQLAVVVLEEDERAHSAFRSRRNSTTFSAPVPSSSIRTVSPRGGGSSRA